jgi:hypothetical protein
MRQAIQFDTTQDQEHALYSISHLYLISEDVYFVRKPAVPYAYVISVGFGCFLDPSTIDS